jgi:UDP-N-acetylglucosamine 2-epimerase
LAASSVLRCEAQRDAIGQALARALAMDCSGTVNPYGDGRSAERIVAVLTALPSPATLLQKTFHWLEFAQ